MIIFFSFVLLSPRMCMKPFCFSPILLPLIIQFIFLSVLFFLHAFFSSLQTQNQLFIIITLGLFLPYISLKNVGMRFERR